MIINYMGVTNGIVQHEWTSDPSKLPPDPKWEGWEWVPFDAEAIRPDSVKDVLVNDRVEEDPVKKQAKENDKEEVLAIISMKEKIPGKRWDSMTLAEQKIHSGVRPTRADLGL